MTWFGWYLLIAWWVNMALTVTLIDKPRPPITRTIAVIVLLTTLVQTVLLLKVGV